MNNYVKRSLKDNIIYPDFCYHETEVETNLGTRAPWFYLHGKLEKIVGFDCFNVSIPLLQNFLRCNMILATTVIESVEYKCLVFCEYKGRQMEGYAVLIDDIEAIKDAIKRFPNAYQRCLGDTPDEYLKEHHNEVYNLL